MKVELFRRYRGALAAISAVLLESAVWTSKSSPISGLAMGLGVFSVLTILAANIVPELTRARWPSIWQTQQEILMQVWLWRRAEETGMCLGQERAVVWPQGPWRGHGYCTEGFTHKSVSILKRAGKWPKEYSQDQDKQCEGSSRNPISRAAHRHNDEVMCTSTVLGWAVGVGVDVDRW